VERAWSHYLHMVRYGAEKEEFQQALRFEQQRIREGKKSWMAYFPDGLYPRQLEAWFHYYSRERFLLLLTEDLKTGPREVARRMFEFLGVDTRVGIEVLARKNAASAARYRWLAALLNSPNSVTNNVKLVVPYTSRKHLRDWVNQWNRTAYAQGPTLDPDVAADLRARYHGDISRLERIMGRDLSQWRQSAR
jgi:hypothetical protein